MLYNYVSLSEKYRPYKLNDVIGQSVTIKLLKKIVKNNINIPQVMLFFGPKGVGKTTCARILSMNINKINNNFINYNYDIVELDAASNNSVEDIRKLSEQIYILPNLNRYKIYILDEVHMLSKSAFNSFLKILEFPPKYIIFILVTTEKDKVLPTVISRCQLYQFFNICDLELSKYLSKISIMENINVSDNTLLNISRHSNGCVRDALFILERLILYSNNKKISDKSAEMIIGILPTKIYIKIMEYIFYKKIDNVILYVNKYVMYYNIDMFIEDFIRHIRNIIVYKKKKIRFLIINDYEYKLYSKISNLISIDKLTNMLFLCQKYINLINRIYNKKIFIEIMLIKCIYILN